MVILERSTNIMNFSEPNLKPGNKAPTKIGINISINNIKIKRKYINIDKILEANSTAKELLSFSSCCIFLTKIGTKAELKAPSAKIRRKKLGNLKAAKKISESKLTPRNLAIKTSLIKPRILEMEIKNEIVKADFINAINQKRSRIKESLKSKLHLS